MPLAPFPEHPDAARLFTSFGKINAVLPLSRLGRFAVILPDSIGEIEVKLQFGLEEVTARRRLKGSLKGTVQQLCQRCLEPMPFEVHCQLDLMVLDSEEELAEFEDAQSDASETVDIIDAIVASDEELDILGIIEDELIVSLPLVPLHQNDDCNQVLNSLKAKKDEVQKSQNPFAALAAMKTKAAESKGSAIKGPEDGSDSVKSDTE